MTKSKDQKRDTSPVNGEEKKEEASSSGNGGISKFTTTKRKKGRQGCNPRCFMHDKTSPRKLGQVARTGLQGKFKRVPTGRYLLHHCCIPVKTD